MAVFNSIQTRLVVAVISLSAAIVGCFTAFSFWQIHSGLQDALQGEAAVMISPFLRSVSRELPDEPDNPNLKLFVRVQVAAKGASLFPELVRVHAILRGLIFLEPDGKILRKEGKEEHLSDDVYRAVTSGESYYGKNDSGTVVIAEPFVYKGTNLGSTVLIFSTERVKEQEQRILLAAVSVFFFFLVTGIMGAVVVARGIAGPIVNLTEKIRTENFSESDLEMSRQDELGTLSRRYAWMRKDIREKITALRTEITARKLVETQLRETFDRSLLQQAAISELSVQDSMRDADFHTAARAITEKTAKALKVNRVSLWLLEEDDTFLHCLDSFDKATLLHAEGGILEVAGFPQYFNAMMQLEPVAVEDVYTDSRTRELVEEYFSPLGICSTIDVGLHLEGKPIGVICCETTTEKRQWKPDELVFVSRIADQASIALSVSHRLLAETARKRSEEDLRITLDSIGDAVLAADADGRITRMNPVAEQITGWKLADVLGRDLAEVYVVLDKESRERQENPMNRIAQKPAVVDSEKQWLLVARDATECLIAESVSPLRNDSGEIVGIVLVFRDITQQMEREQQTRQAEKMQAVGQLAGGVAHDFNNMLAGIIGATELLGYRFGDDPKSQHLLKVILQASHSAADLVNKLLVFSRKGKTLNHVVDISPLVDDTVSILKRSIDKRIQLKTAVKAVHRHVSGDPSLLQNAILNLAINARDALPEGGTITINADNVILDELYCRTCSFDILPGEYILISVQDNGTGIPENLKMKIFEPFFTTKEQGRGTGLGLSAVYGTVRDHGGAVNVYSEVGHGTIFNLYLPICHLKDAPLSGRETPATVASGTVLVIDDEEIVRVTVSQMLEKLGFSVLVAENGEEGVQLFQQHMNRIDLVLLDMIMPVVSGAEVFEQLRKIDNTVKVIIASGFAQNDTISEMLEDGLVDFLKKPYSLAALNTVVTEAIAAG